MNGSWLGFGVAAAVAISSTIWLYRRWELPVPGRAWLAALRTTLLVLVVLLLFDPRMPARGSVGNVDSWVLLDASRSLAATDSLGLRVWQDAITRARRALDDDSRIVLFGERVESVPAVGLDSVVPAMTSSRLAPALNRAAEAGVTDVTVVSDLRIDDPSTTLATLDRLGLGVAVEHVGGGLRNASVARFDHPSSVEEGDSVQVQVAIHAEGSNADSVTVEIREEGRLVGVARAGLPSAGRRARVPFTLPPPTVVGPVLYSATVLLDGDSFARDDQRLGIIRVADEVGGIVLVSTTPDWEPRFLLPVLAQVTGIPARGYLALADGRFVPTGSVAEAAAPVGGGEVRQRAEEASLLVVHGLGGTAPEWLVDLAETAPRALILVDDAEGAAHAGVFATAPQPGEWYAPPDPPASALTGELTDIGFTGLPPLAGLLPLVERDARAPLVVQRQGIGTPEAGIILREEQGRRHAVALAKGFWRWAFRDGEPRDAYRRVWASVAGWVLREDPTASGARVAPVSEVLPEGVPMHWRAPGRAGDSLRVRLSSQTESHDTLVLVEEDGSFRTRAFGAGGVRFAVDRNGDTLSTGRVGIEGYTDDLLHAALTPGALDRVANPGIRELARGAGRPLRTHPLPYVVALVLLCAEWVGRRRHGLR